MAKIWQISDGRSYVVNGDPGTTITYTNSPSNGTAAGKPVTSIPTGATSVTFPSNGSEVEISSDTATIDQVFNAAAAGSGSSSGGSGSAGGVTFQIVTTLPSQGAAGVIYLVKVSETGDDKFEEWIWVDSAWESIGTTAVDPTTYAKLIGGNTFEGDQVINGDLTVTGDVSGVVENSYYLTETTSTTINPRAGTWTRYTGSETALTIEEPAWTGEVDLAYLETPVPVTLTGVTWSPAAPVLTGDGPFVYTLVHSKEGEVLAGAYGYSTPTAEAIQAVAPIKWGANYIFGNSSTTAVSNIMIGDSINTANSGFVGIGSNITGGDQATAIGNRSAAHNYTVAIGSHHKALTRSVAIGTYDIASGVAYAKSDSNCTVNIGCAAEIANNADNTANIGYRARTTAATAVTIGSAFTETIASGNVAHTCTTEGTGSITIGAGANTLNNGSTESSNSVTIGCKASNSSADSVVIGAGANNNSVSSGLASCSIGAGAVTTSYSVAVGKGSQAQNHGVSVGYEAKGLDWSVCLGGKAKSNSFFSVSIGAEATAKSHRSVAIGGYATTDPESTIVIGADAAITNTGSTPSTNTTVIGAGATASAPTALTFGAAFSDTSGDYTCTTEGTGSITIGAGANTKNTTTTVDGVETTVESSNSVTIGCKASNTGADSVVIGAKASSLYFGGVAIGAQAYAGFQHAISIGNQSTSANVATVSLGYAAKTTYHSDIAIGNQATSAGNSSIAIGKQASASAQNAVVMGAGASAAGEDSVVLGKGASGTQADSVIVGTGATEKNTQGKNVVIGKGAEVDGYQGMTSIGFQAKANYYGVSVGFQADATLSGTAVGRGAHAAGHSSVALGQGAQAKAGSSVAIGINAVVDDIGTVVFAANTDPQSNVSADWRKTQLYFSGANTPLANEYYNGEAFMGYTVMDASNNVLACGTRRLSELFTDNTLTQPATIDEETGEWVQPKVFHPSDLDLPVEEPTEEPEDVTTSIPEPSIPEPEPYTPLPVYPLVTPEDVTTNMPETEPYTPLPVYPIVEPEVPEIVEEPTE